ncbi:unnamed protein product [Brassica oleracea var. botrytis]
MFGEIEFQQASILGPPPPGVRCTSDVTLSLGVGVRCNPLDHSDGSRLALIGRFQRLFNSSKQYTHPLSSLLLFLSGE